jgi:leucyl-tRNA---protein transferase
VARALQCFVEDPRPCSYLDGIEASLEHRVLLDVSAHEVDFLLDRGWRHFGPGWFRPACQGCQACVSVRIPVDGFVPSASQRRAYRRASQLRVTIGEPSIDQARLALFHVWQEERVRSRSWEPSHLDARDYFMQFAFPTGVEREVAYFDDEADGKLVMVSICDQTPLAWNAVFCFYDPAYRRMSPGIANILTLIDLARQTGRRHVHLGYYVSQCQSLRYKAAFSPCETLVGLPNDDDEAPRWQRDSGGTFAAGVDEGR